MSQNEVETHANCREPSAEKVSDGEENGSNFLAKDCEPPDLDHDSQSFSGQFDNDKDHFEVSENGVLLETLDSCSGRSQADSQFWKKASAARMNVRFAILASKERLNIMVLPLQNSTMTAIAKSMRQLSIRLVLPDIPYPPRITREEGYLAMKQKGGSF